MQNLGLIIVLILFNFLSIIFFMSLGRTFLFITKYKNIKQITIYEEGLIGLIILGFLSILINFFFPISKIITSTFFLFFILFFFFKKNLLISNIKKILIICFFSSIILILSKINTPDAGLYHLPFTQLINDFKILIGSSNIHYRFGAASTIQYVSAFFNNFLFKENGINIPVAVLFGLFISFFLDRLFFYLKESKKKNYFDFRKYFFFFFNNYFFAL